MNGNNKFTFDKSMAAGMRRRAFVPLLLILPMAVMFGLDPSKSQPTHFLMTFGIGIACGAIVVLISRSAAQRQIAHLSELVLTVENKQIIWTSAIGRSVADIDRVRNMSIQERGGKARAIVLTFEDGSRKRLQGFVGMSRLSGLLEDELPPGIGIRRTWMPV